MTAVDVLYLTGGGMVAVPLLGVCVYWTRRAVLDAVDSRRESASPPVSDQPAPEYPPIDTTDVLIGVVVPRGELVPAADVTTTARVFEPPAYWWLTGWTPRSDELEPALIGDALTALWPLFTVPREAIR